MCGTTFQGPFFWGGQLGPSRQLGPGPNCPLFSGGQLGPGTIFTRLTILTMLLFSQISLLSCMSEHTYILAVLVYHGIE